MHILFSKSTLMFSLKHVSEQTFLLSAIDNIDCAVVSIMQYLTLVDISLITSVLEGFFSNENYFKFKNINDLHELNI